MAKTRPEPRYVDGYFVPSVPVPDPKPIADYKWTDTLPTITTLARNPLETFNAKHYEIPVSQYPLMGMWFTVINHPDFIRHCFVEKRKNLGFQAVRQAILKPIIGDGLITAEGETWSHARKAMSPMFTPRNIRHFGEVMRRCAEGEIDDLFEDGKVYKTAAPISALTYQVLSATLFSKDIETDTAKTVQDVATILNHMGRPDPMDLFGAPNWVPRLTRLPGMKAVRNVRAMIAKIITKRRADIAQNKDVPDDFISRLLSVGGEDTTAFTDQQIEDHMVTFIGAGHETTARALVWMFYLLANDTKIRDRVETEVDALDVENIPPETWGDYLPFATACFEETMRLFPPAPLISRQILGDDVYGTTFLPANSVLMVNLWQLHRHKQLWDRPNAFDPERFIGTNRDKIDRFQYLPFGVGERVCIGQRFAMQEALILVALLCRKYRFDYASDKPPWPVMRITVKPENDMPMKITRRL